MRPVEKRSKHQLSKYIVGATAEHIIIVLYDHVIHELMRIYTNRWVGFFIKRAFDPSMRLLFNSSVATYSLPMLWKQSQRIDSEIR